MLNLRARILPNGSTRKTVSAYTWFCIVKTIIIHTSNVCVIHEFTNPPSQAIFFFIYSLYTFFNKSQTITITLTIHFYCVHQISKITLLLIMYTLYGFGMTIFTFIFSVFRFWWYSITPLKLLDNHTYT